MNKNKLKLLVAAGRLDEAIDELLNIIDLYIIQNPDDKFVGKLSDALIINSGKFKGLIHDENLGILSSKEKKIISAEVNKAILYVIAQLSDEVFQLSSERQFSESSNTEQNRLREGVKLLHTEKRHFEYDLFLSFSSKDREEARQVWEKLRGYGLRVFLSDEALKINIGTSFFEKINYGLANSQHLVWLCTPDSIQSKYVKMETEAFFHKFFENTRRLIILKGKGFNMDILLPMYQTLQVADNAEQIVHALIDKARLDKQEKERVRKEQEEAEKKRLADIEAKRQREHEELEQRALEELESKQREEAKRIKNEKLRIEQQRQAELHRKELAEKAENVFWQQVQNRNTKTAYKQYLQKYPQGKYAYEAQKSIEIIEAQKQPIKVQSKYIIIGIAVILIIVLWKTYPWTSNTDLNDNTADTTSIEDITQPEEEKKEYPKIIDGITWTDEKNGTFTDTRDNKTYKVVRIGQQIWMAENLAYKASSGCWAYKNNSSNVSKYGYLYNWKTAKNVCPSGWHLPIDDEWKQLEMALGMSKKDADDTGYRGSPVGKKLKSTSWDGNNESGFNALPGGLRYYDSSDFGGEGANAYFWSATPEGTETAWYRYLYSGFDEVLRYNWYRTYGHSIRCLKDN